MQSHVARIRLMRSQQQAGQGRACLVCKVGGEEQQRQQQAVHERGMHAGSQLLLFGQVVREQCGRGAHDDCAQSCDLPPSAGQCGVVQCCAVPCTV